jgi:hypothetical protein
MRRETRPAVLPVVFAAIFALAPARAAFCQMPFAVFGARQAALGGAAVALGDDPAGFMNNPALLNPAGTSYAGSLGVLATSGADFYPLVKGVAGNDPAELATPGSPNAGAVRANLAALAAPGVGALAEHHSGLVSVTNGWGVAVSYSGWNGAFARPDLVHVQSGTDPATSFAANTSVAAFRALSVEDYAISRAIPLIQGNLMLGVTGHYLRGTAGIKEEDLFTTGTGRLDDFVRRGSSGGIDRTRSRFSWDAGLLVTIGVLRIGAVMNGINRPQFPYDDQTTPAGERGRTVTIGQQTRAGASVKIPGTGLTVAADLDLRANETLVDGLSSRVAGGGLEWLISSFALRGGLSIDLEAPDRPKVLSGGLGWQSGTFRADVSATYRSNDGALGGVATVRVGI